MSNDRMHRVLELQEQLAAIKIELSDLLRAGLPGEGGFPVSMAISLLTIVDDHLADALFDCGIKTTWPKRSTRDTGGQA